MGTYFLLVVVLSIAGANAQTLNFTQPQHDNLTQYANLLCTLNSTAMQMTMNFNLWINNDSIPAVFTRNNTLSTQNSIGTFDSLVPIGILGTGATNDQFTFDILFDCSSSPPTLDNADVSNKFLYTVGTDSVGLNIVSKSFWDPNILDMLNFADDVIYTAICNCSASGTNVISTGVLFVSGDNAEDLVPLVGNADLVVYADYLNIQTNIVGLGDLMYLAVVLDPNSPAIGAFVFSCDVCDTPECTGGVTVPIIGADGCSLIPLYFSEFDVDLNGLISTASFASFQFNSQIYLYFQCNVGFCFDVADPRCPNYCTYATGKRKKRQAAERETIDPEKIEIVTTGVRIRLGGSQGRFPNPVINNEPEISEPTQDTETVGLIAAVITLAGLLLIGVIAAVVVFFRMSRRREKSEQ